MTDLPDDQPDSDDMTEQPERLALPSADGYMSANDWLTAAVRPKETRRIMRGLHDRKVAADARDAALDAREAAVAAREAAAAEHEKANTAEVLKLHEQKVELETRKDARLEAVIERERKVSALEQKWRFIGEDDDVHSGFRESEFGALYKARTAFGFASDATDGMDSIAKQMAEKFPRGRTVRAGNTGEPFPDSTTITHDLPPPEPPVGGARIRGRRSTDRQPTP